VIPEGETGAGGSYVLSQKWQHHLQAFNQLSVHEQEQVIGRTKQDNVELEGDAMPPTSHVSRTDVKIDGVGQKIYRRSTPYGGAEEQACIFSPLPATCAVSACSLNVCWGTVAMVTVII